MVLTLPSEQGEPMSHAEHTEYTEGCFVCKVSTISFGSSSMPTRRPVVAATEAREKRWSKDMPAYKELRAQGLQPPRIDGAAELATKAETRFEVESGKILSGKGKKIESAIKDIEGITGTSVYKPNTTPVKL